MLRDLSSSFRYSSIYYIRPLDNVKTGKNELFIKINLSIFLLTKNGLILALTENVIDEIIIEHRSRHWGRNIL